MLLIVLSKLFFFFVMMILNRDRILIVRRIKGYFYGGRFED